MRYFTSTISRGTGLLQASLLCGFLLACLPAFAQNAQFQGRVTDAQHAVVAGADVSIVNQATGVERKVKTNGDGSYAVPFVTPGTYTISVQARASPRRRANLSL